MSVDNGRNAPSLPYLLFVICANVLPQRVEVAEDQVRQPVLLIDVVV